MHTKNVNFPNIVTALIIMIQYNRYGFYFCSLVASVESYNQTVIALVHITPNSNSFVLRAKMIKST